MDQTATRSIPDRSAAQRQQALAKANRVRKLRSETWIAWKAGGRAYGCREAARMVLDPPAFMVTCQVSLLLERVPKLGPRRVERIMGGFRIADCRTLGGLSPQKRKALAAFLNLYADPRAFGRAYRRKSGPWWPYLG